MCQRTPGFTGIVRNVSGEHSPMIQSDQTFYTSFLSRLERTGRMAPYFLLRTPKILCFSYLRTPCLPAPSAQGNVYFYELPRD